MSDIRTRSFVSIGDFLGKFFSIFRGPTFFTTFKTINARLREKILLTISVANNCAQ